MRKECFVVKTYHFTIQTFLPRFKKNKKMKSDFKLIGLSKPQSFTCEPLDSDTIFWAENGLGKEKFNELWKYCDGNWQDKKIAEIEHEGLNEDGTPINPVVVAMRELS